jgi:hypothetical protein
MNYNHEAPINFYGTNFEPQIRTDLAPITPQINFAEEIRIRLPKEK